MPARRCSPASLASGEQVYRPASRSRFAARQKIQPTIARMMNERPIAAAAITAEAVSCETLNRSIGRMMAVGRGRLRADAGGPPSRCHHGCFRCGDLRGRERCVLHARDGERRDTGDEAARAQPGRRLGGRDAERGRRAHLRRLHARRPHGPRVHRGQRRHGRRRRLGRARTHEVRLARRALAGRLQAWPLPRPDGSRSTPSRSTGRRIRTAVRPAASTTRAGTGTARASSLPGRTTPRRTGPRTGFSSQHLPAHACVPVS